MENLERKPNGYRKTKSPKRPVEWTEDYAFRIALDKKCVSENLSSKNQIEKNENILDNTVKMLEAKGFINSQGSHKVCSRKYDCHTISYHKNDDSRDFKYRGQNSK